MTKMQKWKKTIYHLHKSFMKEKGEVFYLYLYAISNLTWMGKKTVRQEVKKRKRQSRKYLALHFQSYPGEIELSLNSVGDQIYKCT